MTQSSVAARGSTSAQGSRLNKAEAFRLGKDGDIRAPQKTGYRLNKAEAFRLGKGWRVGREEGTVHGSTKPRRFASEKRNFPYCH